MCYRSRQWSHLGEQRVEHDPCFASSRYYPCVCSRDCTRRSGCGWRSITDCLCYSGVDQRLRLIHINVSSTCRFPREHNDRNQRTIVLKILVRNHVIPIGKSTYSGEVGICRKRRSSCPCGRQRDKDGGNCWQGVRSKVCESSKDCSSTGTFVSSFPRASVHRIG